MRDYLAELRDEMLFDKPLEGEDKDLILWQVLLHVANHGTDHRAQLLRLLEQIATQLMLKADDNPPLPAAGLSRVASGSNAIIASAIRSKRSGSQDNVSRLHLLCL